MSRCPTGQPWAAEQVTAPHGTAPNSISVLGSNLPTPAGVFQTAIEPPRKNVEFQAFLQRLESRELPSGPFPLAFGKEAPGAPKPRRRAEI